MLMLLWHMEVHTEQKKKQDDWPHTTANLSLYSWVSRTQSYSGDGSWPKTAFNLQHLPDCVCAFFFQPESSFFMHVCYGNRVVAACLPQRWQLCPMHILVQKK